MDCRWPLLSLVSTDRRVSSPRAANTDARVFSASEGLCCLINMPRDVWDLLAPTAVIHPERLEATLAWQLVETRLDDAQQDHCRGALQCKLDERRRFTGIVLGRIDRVRMPGEREQPLRLHFLDHGLPSDMLITGMGY